MSLFFDQSKSNFNAGQSSSKDKGFDQFDCLSLLEFERIIICGPTASGKTGLYEEIEAQLGKLGHKVECINADTGQMYRNLKIGTAKPQINESMHCFDILSLGERTCAAQFAKLCLQAEKEIRARGALPIIVGGSFFYIQSLFYPLFEQVLSRPFEREVSNLSLYEQLLKIDPLRAQEVGPNDHYRLSRALDIWFSTKVLPSSLKPQFACEQKTLLMVVDQGQIELDRRINLRLGLMLKSGWVDEVASLSSQEQVFLAETNGLIGYREVLQLVNGQLSAKECQQLIFYKTRNYAKRQRKYFKSLDEKIRKDNSAKNLKIVKLNRCDLSLCVET